MQETTSKANIRLKNSSSMQQRPKFERRIPLHIPVYI